MCRVPGAKAGRDSMDIEVFGMAGVPEDMRPGGVLGTFISTPRHMNCKRGGYAQELKANRTAVS